MVLVEPNAQPDHPHMPTYDSNEESNLSDKIDLIITLGGDGTILHVGKMFQNKIPPVLSFSLGSLGFLLSFRKFILSLFYFTLFFIFYFIFNYFFNFLYIFYFIFYINFIFYF